MLGVIYMSTDELLKLAKQLVDQGAKQGVTLRIIGHLAVRDHVTKHLEMLEILQRIPTHDIDFMGYTKERDQADRMFKELGYKADPSVAFSQEYGVQRLIYHHENGQIMVEIFLDELRMAHTLDFRNRFELDNPTISLVDLLLSKLQIQDISGKDLKDIIVLLAEHETGSGERELIDIDYLLKLTRKNWGLYYTARKNLVMAKDFLAQQDEIDAAIKDDVNAKLDAYINSMDVEPKTARWKLRAKIGTRVKWYEDVGDVYNIHQ